MDLRSGARGSERFVIVDLTFATETSRSAPGVLDGPSPTFRENPRKNHSRQVLRWDTAIGKSLRKFAIREEERHTVALCDASLDVNLVTFAEAS